MPNLNLFNVILEFVGHSRPQMEIRLSRIPCVGEFIELPSRTSVKVTAVSHYPSQLEIPPIYAVLKVTE